MIRCREGSWASHNIRTLVKIEYPYDLYENCNFFDFSIFVFWQFSIFLEYTLIFIASFKYQCPFKIYLYPKNYKHKTALNNLPKKRLCLIKHVEIFFRKIDCLRMADVMPLQQSYHQTICGVDTLYTLQPYTDVLISISPQSGLKTSQWQLSNTKTITTWSAQSHFTTLQRKGNIKCGKYALCD